jgi:hypothetical protein
MTPAIAMDARPGEPALSLSKGPTAKRQPSPEGLGINPEEDPSAVGASLCHPEPNPEPALSEVEGICSSADPSWKCFPTGRSDHRFPIRIVHPSLGQVLILLSPIS